VGAAKARLQTMSLRAVLARNLRQLRQAKGLSQEELADRADVTANYISSLEREEYAASVDVIERLSVALDVPPGAFFASD
jgi:transcriptional regulator with XRE-family HTH domain